MSKGSVYLNITIIVRVITIWYEVLCKLRVSLGGLVTRKKVFLGSSHRIDKHIDAFVEFLEVQKSASFEFCLDE